MLGPSKLKRNWRPSVQRPFLRHCEGEVRRGEAWRGEGDFFFIFDEPCDFIQRTYATERIEYGVCSTLASREGTNQ
jgi:hypothetical protein